MPARFQKGQVLIIVTLAIVGIVAVIGLALDVGITFVQYARLRRAVDAAALAAALQYRIGATSIDLENSADEFLKLNGINDSFATVTTCTDNPSLCTNPPTKIVQVVGHATAQLAFLPVIGISQVPLTAMAQSQAASVDVVLVIDTSESMTFDNKPPTGMNPPYPPAYKAFDPSYCNVVANGAPCQPFQGLKDAAKLFVSKLFFPYDRVAIVDFNKAATLDLDWSSNAGDIDTAIDALQVYQATGDCPGTPCRNYTAGHNDDPLYYLGFGCSSWTAPGDDPEECTTTNTGGGLKLAGNEFATGQQDALWVAILLTDGGANSGGGAIVSPGYACPSSTYWPQPFCRDPNALVRHCELDGTPEQAAHLLRCTTPAPAGEFGDPNRLSLLGSGNHGIWPGGGLDDAADWDAMDYARDMADFVYIDQQALIFSIGLGNDVTHTPFGTADAGAQFLKYAARDGEPNGGQYYFAPSGADLGAIFQSIADNIATRLNK